MMTVQNTLDIREDPEVMSKTCGAISERAQMILVWVRALGVGNTSHPQILEVVKVRPWVMSSLWRTDFKMLKNISISGVS